MIVCSCNLISSTDIAEAVVSLRTNDPFVVITPALIYRHLGKRPSCGNCLPLIDYSANVTVGMAPSAMSDNEMSQVTAGF